MQKLEEQTIRKVSARLIPFLMIGYFIAYLDLVNVGFAALTMNKDLGLTATMFGFGSGVFFLAYFLFEVPSNLFLHRLGARKWIARIMLSWGILSGLMAFIPNISRATGLGNEYSFYLIRILLGLAEAGFFPGIIFYLTLWFPSAYRARIVGMLMAASPISSAIGAPVSAQILNLDWLWGFSGWQWLFVIEAVPAIVLSVVTFFYLTDRPSNAHWLDAEERTWLSGRLEAEQRQRVATHDFSILDSLTNGRILGLAIVYFGAVACLYGVGFWLPQIIKAFGLSISLTGWITAIPYALGALCMILYGRRSDAKGERKVHAAIALAVAVVGIGGSAVISTPALTLVFMTIGTCGMFSALPVFWTLPTALLSGSAAAAGIAAINSIGNLAGFVGPFAIGWIKDQTGSYSAGLLLIAGLALLAMLTVLILGHDDAIEKPPVMLPTE